METEQTYPRIQVKWWVFKSHLRDKWPEKAAQWVAHHLPDRVVIWCVVRVASAVWTGENVEPDKITYPLMYEAWEARKRAPHGRP